MQPKPSIAFVKLGDFSHINDNVLQQLILQFPSADIEVVDIFTDLIRQSYWRNWLHGLWAYGPDILLGRKPMGAAMLRTPFVFHKAKQAMARRLAHRRYAFTFQTQSLFDVSVPGTAHFVYTDHTHLANARYPQFGRGDLYAPAWIECEKTIYRNAACTFTMSTNIAASLIEDYACRPDQVACVYGGANVQATRDEVFDDRRYAAKNILFVGVDWERKGGPVLEEAFRILLGTHPDATLTIVGCSPALHLPNCRIVGRVPLAEVKTYYEHASLFCLPSRLEPFGVAFLEAMAHQLPMIGTNIGAIPDFISDGKNGYLVEPNDPRQLAGKLMALLGDRDRCRAFGKYGRQRFWERYTWAQTGVRIREHIEQKLGSPFDDRKQHPHRLGGGIVAMELVASRGFRRVLEVAADLRVEFTNRRFPQAASRERLLSIAESLALMEQDPRTLIRFGDGECNMMTRAGIYFQEYDPRLARRLVAILDEYVHASDCAFHLTLPNSRLLQSRADIEREGALNVWRRTRHIYFTRCARSRRKFGETEAFKGTDPERYRRILGLFVKASQVIVVNDRPWLARTHLTPFPQVRIHEVTIPATNAYSRLDRILHDVLAVADRRDFRLDLANRVLVGAGPCGKLLAYDLMRHGLTTLDVGKFFHSQRCHAPVAGGLENPGQSGRVDRMTNGEEGNK